MLSWIREKFGAVVISVIIGLIALVFIFEGVFMKGGGRGGAGDSVAGTVNGESIPRGEFARALNSRLEMFKGMGGGGLTEAQIAQFGLREGVFQELVDRRLMIQGARKLGQVASDEEVKARIQEMPAFKKDGAFSSLQYKQVLAANNLSPAGFEKMMREDLSVQALGDYFGTGAKVSEEELKREFLQANDKRILRYVHITPEAARKAVNISQDEITKFLADQAKLGAVKAKYEALKGTELKGKTFDQAKDGLAKEMVAAEKSADVLKGTDEIAARALAALTPDKASDARVHAALKPYGLEVKKSGWVTRQTTQLPGVGEAKEVLIDAFAKNSPIDPEQGGKAKKYNLGPSVVIALVSDSQAPNPAQFDEAKKDELRTALRRRKEGELFQAWMKQQREGAKIQKNTAIVGGEGDGGGA